MSTNDSDRRVMLYMIALTLCATLIGALGISLLVRAVIRRDEIPLERLALLGVWATFLTVIFYGYMADLRDEIRRGTIRPRWRIDLRTALIIFLLVGWLPGVVAAIWRFVAR